MKNVLIIRSGGYEPRAGDFLLLPKVFQPTHEIVLEPTPLLHRLLKLILARSS